MSDHTGSPGGAKTVSVVVSGQGDWTVKLASLPGVNVSGYENEQTLRVILETRLGPLENAVFESVWDVFEKITSPHRTVDGRIRRTVSCSSCC